MREAAVATRWAPLFGIAFAVLLIAGFVILGGTPDYSSPEDWTGYYEDGGNRTQHIFAGYLLLLSAFAFLAFGAGIVNRLRATQEGADGLPTLALASGVLFVAMLLTTATVAMGVPASVSFGGASAPSGELAIQFEQLAIGFLLLPGMLSAAVFVFTSSIAGRRVGLLPGWISWAGIIIAPILLLSPLFLPMLLLPLWALVAGVVLFVRSR